jgi:peptidoglycan L-alanyl-D-glutamate endopeptidase CwlK
MASYRFGNTSKENLATCHPDLIRVFERAIQITPQDFMLFEGLRTEARQQKLFKAGASKLDGKIKRSRHQANADGVSEAGDAVPYVGGPRWEWPLIYPMAAAVHTAAAELGVGLRWGGVWDRPFAALEGTPDGLQRAVRAYTLRHAGPDFLDGPHFELL